MSSPPRKRVKEEEEEISPSLPSSGLNYGVIRFEIDQISTLRQSGRCSKDVEVGGVPWKLEVCKETDEMGAAELACYVQCRHDQRTPWSITAKCQIALINEENHMNITKEWEPSVFSKNNFICDVGEVNWSEFADEQKKFIKDNKLTVEARISISDMSRVRVPPSFDFNDPSDPLHDVALVIGGEKVYVSKAILASQSPVFKVMFYGNFDENNRKEIELKEVDREEFLEMLRVIYPSFKRITDDTVEFLLKLADRFQITSLIEGAEDYLIPSTTISHLDKIRLADQYRLMGLMDHCIAELKTKKDFKDIKESPIFGDLSAETSKALFERLLKKFK